MRLIQVVSLLVGFSGTSCRDETQHVSEFRNAAISRAPRASQDEFSAITDQLAVSARLITAVTLQNGLIDGSIPSDKAFAELLNIESVDLAQLESFDKQKVDGFVEKLKALGTSIAADGQISSTEDMLTLMNKLRIKYAELGNLSDTSSAKSFFAVVENASTSNLNKTFIDEFLNAADSTQKILNDMPSLSSRLNYQIYFNLEELRLNLLKVIDAPQKFNNFTEQLEKLKPLVVHEFTRRSSQLRFVHLLDIFHAQVTKFSGSSPNDYDKLISLLSNVTSLEPDAKSCRKDGDVIGAVVLSKSMPRHSRRQYTSGFLNGYSDITRLANDVNNLQFKTIARGFDFDVLISRLLPLQSLMDNAANVEKKLAVLPDTFRSMRLVSGIIRNFASFGKLPEKAALVKINSCIKPQSTSVFYKDIAAFFNDKKLLAVNLGVALSTAKKLPASSLFIKLAELTELKNSVKFSSEDRNIRVQEAPAILVEVKKQKIDIVAKAVADTRSDLQKFKNAVDEVVRRLGSLSKQTTVVTEFLGHADTKKIVSFFECLKNPDLESVSSVIEITQEIREFIGDPQMASNIATSTSLIDGSRAAVKTLQSTSAALKGKQNQEPKQVSSLKGLEKEAGNFGESVLALEHVRHVLEKKNQLENFSRDRSGVEEEIDKVQNPQLQSELKEDWGLFEATKQDLSELLTDLEKRRDQMKVPKASKFADYAPVFSAMKGLKGVDLQVRKRLRVLETLCATNQTFKNMKQQLEELADLDLQFARFHKPLSQISVTLDNLDEFFESLNPVTTKKPLLYKPNLSLASDSSTESSYYIYSLIVFSNIGLFIVFIVILWIIKRNCGGQKQEDGKLNVQVPAARKPRTTMTQKNAETSKQNMKAEGRDVTKLGKQPRSLSTMTSQVTENTMGEGLVSLRNSKKMIEDERNNKDNSFENECTLVEQWFSEGVQMRSLRRFRMELIYLLTIRNINGPPGACKKRVMETSESKRNGATRRFRCLQPLSRLPMVTNTH